MWNAIQDLFTGINPATLNGAIDVVVVRQPDGTLQSSPFHVRFGKSSLFRPRERVVYLKVNGEPVEGLKMKVGAAGEGFFVTETNEEPPERLCTSPIMERHMSIPTDVKSGDETLSPTTTEGSVSEDARPTSDSAVGSMPFHRTSSEITRKKDSQDSSVTEDDSIVNWDWGDLPVSKDDEESSPQPRSEKHRRHRAPSETFQETMEQESESDTSVTMSPPRVHGHSKSNGASPSRAGSLGVYLSDINLDELRAEGLSSGASDEGEGGGYDSDEEGSEGETNHARAQHDANGAEVDFPRLATSLPTSLSPLEHKLKHHRPMFPSDLGSCDEPEESRPVALSLCGLGKGQDKDQLAQSFAQHRVTWQQFSQDPSLLFNPKLVVKIDDRFLAWEVAAPVIMAQLAFGKSLSRSCFETLQQGKSEPAKTDRSWNWFLWKSQTGAAASKTGSATLVAGQKATAAGTTTVAAAAITTAANPAPSATLKLPVKENFTKTLKLTSDQLKELGLRDGINKMSFTVYSKIQGKSTVSCSVFLWDYSDRIVISDIDGTITRSDVMGHAAGFLGQDWTHNGVASLFTAVAANGYKLLYLSSRSIGYSSSTKGYLRNVKQQETGLPEGPVLLAPTSLLRSIHVEVIARRPEEFKIACLQDIRNLFRPANDRPFVAGFGNRPTDEVSYRAVGIEDSKIFIIDPKGLIKQPKGAYRSSYVKLKDIVDSVFPPLPDDTKDTKAEDRRFDAHRYYKPSVPAADDEMLKEMGLLPDSA